MSTDLATDQLCLTCSTLAQTERFGQTLGSLLFPGAVVALVGPLGAGKTALTRAIAEGLEITDPHQVTSPTFVLLQEYSARLPIYHFDVYRLRHGSEFVDLGAAEYLGGQGVCLIEWADKIQPLLPKEHLRVEMEPVDSSSRHVILSGWGERSVQLIQALRGHIEKEIGSTTH